jgi:hypothetical protein
MLRTVLARARRRPGRWLLTVLGLALATGFAGAVSVESTVAGDQAARSVLSRTTELERTVAITWPNPVSPAIERRANAVLQRLSLGPRSAVLLLAGVRLNGTIVRLAAIDPAGSWLASAPGRGVSRCTAARCPMLLLGGTLPRRVLTAAGVRIVIAGRAELRSAAALGFVPGAGQPPLLLSGDVMGLASVTGLSGIFRTHSWIALLPVGDLHAWQLAGVERQLAAAQSSLLASGSGFSFTGPFATLDAARAQAATAPRRLLLAGGGSLAALILFLVLTVATARRDVEAELSRLELAGARSLERFLFVGFEAAAVCGAGLLLGALCALASGAALAAGAGIPVDGALDHSLLTPQALIVLCAGWLLATALLTGLLLARGPRVARAIDLAAAAAAAALVAALLVGNRTSSQLSLLLAPLACLAAGVLVFRGAALLLRSGERLSRGGRVMTRLALVGLARSPSAPSLAIAFIALSIGLGGFALAYRATLLRSTSDQAANQVPLDVTVSSGPDFATPLQLASLARWQQLARGSAWPVRRTTASYVNGDSSVTVPALGVPAGALRRVHGWRAADASAPLAMLARRLTPARLSAPGPALPAGSRALELRASAAGLMVRVEAELTGPGENLIELPLHATGKAEHGLVGRLPQTVKRGGWALSGFKVSEPAGLAATSGHQNAENPAPPAPFTTALRLQAPSLVGPAGARRLDISRWRAVGATSEPRPVANGISVRFNSGAETGLVRPPATSDSRPVPVVVDPGTGAVAGPGHEITLTVDGLPVRGRVVGEARRFPTIPADSSGFLLADEGTLASALDAQAPGQGRPDELWLSTSHPQMLRAAMSDVQFRQLRASFRADLQRQLRSAPVARAVLRTLLAASLLTDLLAVIGLLVTLLGPARDRRVEDDLIAQGVGPAALRRETQLRLLVTATLGVVLGAVIGIALTRLAVAAVRAAAGVAVPQPPVLAVAPWAELGLWSLAALAAFTAGILLATRTRAGVGTR